MIPSTGDKQEVAERAAEELQGSARSLDDVMTEEQRDDVDVMRLLDELVFECPECGWWCEIAEQTDDGRCDDCNPDCGDEG